MLVSESTDDSRTIKDKNTKMIFFHLEKMIYIFTFLSCFPVIEIIWFNCVPFLGKGIRKITEGVNLTQKSHPVEVLVPGAEHIVHLMTKNWGDNDSIFQDVIETRGRGEKWDCVGYSLRQFTMSCGLIYMYIILESIEYTRYKDHNFSLYWHTEYFKITQRNYITVIPCFPYWVCQSSHLNVYDAN